MLNCVLIATTLVLSARAQCSTPTAAPAEEPAARSELPFYHTFEDGTGAYGASVVGSEGCSSWVLLDEGMFTRSALQGCHSGVRCWSTGLNQYTQDEDSALTLPPFDFGARTEPPHLSFWLWHDTVVSRDGLIVEMSFDDGDSWARVGSRGGAWYNNAALVGGSEFVDAFSGSISGWRHVSTALAGAEGQSKVWLRLRFVATGVPRPNSGVLIDDLAVQASAAPPCPVPITPANGATVRPLPSIFTWEPVPAADYYDIRFALAQDYKDAPLVGAGDEPSWPVPALSVGVHAYSIHSRLADGTTNFFCPPVTFVAAPQGIVKQFPYTADFNSLEMSGWSNVAYDTGRFVQTNGQIETASYSPYEFYVLESPPFDLANLRTAKLSLNILWSFPSGSGVMIQWTNNRGQQWHPLGVVGTGKDWYNSADIAAFKQFLGPGRYAGWSGKRENSVLSEFNINAGTMGFDWVPCAEELYFRIVMATAAGTGDFKGVQFDNFRLVPDPAAETAADACDVADDGSVLPPFVQETITPAPTPVFVPRETTTTEETTTTLPTTTTTTTTTTMKPRTMPPTTEDAGVTTRLPTQPGDTIAPTPVPAGETTEAPETTTTLTTSTLLSTPAPTPAEVPADTRTLPPFVPREVTDDANAGDDDDSDVTTINAVDPDAGRTTEPDIAEPTGLTETQIGLLIGGILFLCILCLLLGLFIKRKNDEDEKEEAERDADAELRRAAEEQA